MQSEYLKNRLVDAVFRGERLSLTPYVALHTVDPGKTGAGEVQGGNYHRLAGAFTRAAGGETTNSEPLSFEAMPASTIVAVGVWDAPVGGQFLWGALLLAEKVVNQADTFMIARNDLYFAQTDE